MKLEYSQDKYLLELSAIDKFFSIRGNLSIPVENVISTELGYTKKPWWVFRVGTYLPWVIRAGTYFTSLGKEFWLVYYFKKDLVVTLELKNEKYKRLVISLSDIPTFLNELLSH